MPGTPTPFSIEQRHDADAVTLLLRGELDLAAAPQLSACLKEHASERRRVLVDFRRLEFIDSSGLAVLIRAAADARRDGWDIAIVRGGSPEVEKVLALVALDEMVPFTDAP